MQLCRASYIRHSDPETYFSSVKQIDNIFCRLKRKRSGMLKWKWKVCGMNHLVGGGGHNTKWKINSERSHSNTDIITDVGNIYTKHNLSDIFETYTQIKTQMIGCSLCFSCVCLLLIAQRTWYFRLCLKLHKPLNCN